MGSQLSPSPSAFFHRICTQGGDTSVPGIRTSFELHVFKVTRLPFPLPLQEASLLRLPGCCVKAPRVFSRVSLAPPFFVGLSLLALELRGPS